ncbi:hypothetical protein NLX83_37325 [Allokutzneria sp. A3M-2-11 16]|uniref:hypothetical protein n=1 Tax=Allokutzneria sp. A3M-2-11 16 TaxID=2962043 RepID=UPI0020B88FC8|nr:hypothetical protein [Allokutzneria sp. A3M-2-11 16]MCP3804943.1 hypothetical protein [Allokutzneria sp. A3M-2-11 16]
MQWITVVSTALGALIALVAMMLNERVKWQREQVSSRRKQCHEVYASFLSALTEAHERMRDSPAAEVREVFREANCYPLRYQLAIVAGQEVVDGGEAVFQTIRDIRDLLAGGARIESAQYKELRRRFGAELRELQRRMRDELGVAPVQLAGGS